MSAEQDFEQAKRAARILLGEAEGRVEETISAMVAKEVKLAVLSLKLWVFGGLAVNLLPVIFLAYNIGQFTNTVTTAMEATKAQQTTLAEQRSFNTGFAIRLQGVESYLGQRGYSPPPERPSGR